MLTRCAPVCVSVLCGFPICFFPCKVNCNQISYKRLACVGMGISVSAGMVFVGASSCVLQTASGKAMCSAVICDDSCMSTAAGTSSCVAATVSGSCAVCGVVVVAAAVVDRVVVEMDLVVRCVSLSLRASIALQ